MNLFLLEHPNICNLTLYDLALFCFCFGRNLIVFIFDSLSTKYSGFSNFYEKELDFKKLSNFKQ